MQDTSENGVPVAGTAPDPLAGEDPGITQPAAHQSHESTPAPSKASASDEGRPRKNASDLGRSRTLRRLVMIGAALAALLAIYLIIQFVLNERTLRGNNGAQPAASNQLKEEAPWRLVVRNDGSATAAPSR